MRPGPGGSWGARCVAPPGTPRMLLGARAGLADQGGDPMAIAIDPVCGMEVEMESAILTSEYEGTVYYFCGKGCKLDFDEDPEKYLDPEYVPQGM